MRTAGFHLVFARYDIVTFFGDQTVPINTEYPRYSKPDMIDLFRNDCCKMVDVLKLEKFRPGFVYTISKMTKFQYNDLETKMRTEENANS